MVYNYGPTENTVVSNFQILQRRSHVIPIGPPVANTQSYIVNEDLRPQPIGVPGELCVSGVQLACGYLNQPELTDEKFFPHHFRPGVRLYRTGGRCQNRGSILVSGISLHLRSWRTD